MKNKSMIKSKNAGIPAVFLDFAAYVAFVLVVIIFYFLFTAIGKGVKENKISELENSARNGIFLSNYLRTPFINNGQPPTMVDMLALYNNENDKEKKNEYYGKLLDKTKEILNSMEYCSEIKGISDKAVNGYAIFLLDAETYADKTKLLDNYGASAMKTDKKFRSKHFYDSSISEIYTTTIPSLVPGNVIYLGLFVSSVNTFGEDVKAVRYCE